ncbi:MAG: NFACT family protein [Vulcanimicrobiaceae bacterium]
MLTDWLIVRRLAAELERALRGARLRDVGRLADGRFGLRVPAGVLAIDAFGPTPIVALESDAPLDRAAGWVRTMSDALVGLRIDAIRARRGDRLVAIECSSRSRFGVTSGYRLVVELVPRFGNIVLLKDDTVVSAAKEFSRADNARRATTVGDTYEPPPLPDAAPGAPALRDAFAEIVRADGDGARKIASAALRARVPLVPRLVAESLVAEVVPLLADATVAALAERAIARATNVLSSTEGVPDGIGDVFAYRDGERLVQCHVFPLAQYASLAMTRSPALLPLVAEVGRVTQARSSQAFDARRASLRARVEKRRATLAGECATLVRERDDASARDDLRAAGDALYAHLAEIPSRATSFVPPSDPARTIALDPDLDAKGNAALYFKRYRKAATKLEHVARRLEELDAERIVGDELAWELERADAETLDELGDAVARFERRKSAPKISSARKRKPMDVRVAEDARVYVGRSPAGNADLTFRLARPDDLWFHARQTPGAHVVLRIDAAREPSPGELERAASLAAYYSKASASEKVSVDYTERKHVRRQQNAPPGLVWYTNARTLLVAPAGVS